MPIAHDERKALESELRRRVLQHNRQVLGLTFLTALAAACLWILLYLAAGWLMLLFASAVHGGDARPLPHFRGGFALLAGVLLGIAWLHRRFHPDDRARDQRSAAELAGDIVLLVPRITLAIWGNLSAWLRLPASERAAAADLLEKVRAQRRLPLHQVPTEIPDEATRERTIFALLLLGVAEIRKADGVVWLHRTRAPEDTEPELTE